MRPGSVVDVSQKCLSGTNRVGTKNNTSDALQTRPIGGSVREATARCASDDQGSAIRSVRRSEYLCPTVGAAPALARGADTAAVPGGAVTTSPTQMAKRRNQSLHLADNLPESSGSPRTARGSRRTSRRSGD